MGTGPFRIRSLLIYLKQVSIHSIKLFSQDVFIQKLRFQSTFLRHELSSARGFSFPLRGNPRLGRPQGKDDQMFSSVRLCISKFHLLWPAGNTTRRSAQDQIWMDISPSVFSWAAKLRLNMGPCQEWAEGTSDQKSWRKLILSHTL